MFAIAPLAFRTEAQRKIFLGVLVVLGGYLGLTALFETVGPHALVFPRYITNPELGYHVGRARGRSSKQRQTASPCSLCGIAAAVAASTWRVGRLIRGLCGIVVGLCFAGCLFSLSRGVWIGAAVAIVLTLVFCRPVRGLLAPALIVIPLAVVALIVLVPGLAGSIDERGNQKDSCGTGRTSTQPRCEWSKQGRCSGSAGGASPMSAPHTSGRRRSAPDSGGSTELRLASGLGATEQRRLETAMHDARAQRLPLERRRAGIDRGDAVDRCGSRCDWRSSISFGSSLGVPWRIGLLAIASMWGIVILFTPLEGPFSPVVLWTWAGIVWASGRRYRDAGSGGPRGPPRRRTRASDESASVSRLGRHLRQPGIFDALEMVFPVRFESRATERRENSTQPWYLAILAIPRVPLLDRLPAPPGQNPADRAEKAVRFVEPRRWTRSARRDPPRRPGGKPQTIGRPSPEKRSSLRVQRTRLDQAGEESDRSIGSR